MNDKIMADIERLAEACAFWYHSCACRGQLDESSFDWYDAGFQRSFDRVRDQYKALEILADRGPRGQRARRHAAHAIRRRFGRIGQVHIYGFGPGWRSLPSVSVRG